MMTTEILRKWFSISAVVSLLLPIGKDFRTLCLPPQQHYLLHKKLFIIFIFCCCFFCGRFAYFPQQQWIPFRRGNFPLIYCSNPFFPFFFYSSSLLSMIWRRMALPTAAAALSLFFHCWNPILMRFDWTLCDISVSTACILLLMEGRWGEDPV